jgi:hypothetical protein
LDDDISVTILGGAGMENEAYVFAKLLESGIESGYWGVACVKEDGDVIVGQILWDTIYTHARVSQARLSNGIFGGEDGVGDEFLTQSVNVFGGVNSDDTLAFGGLLESCDTDPKSTGIHGLSKVCAGEVCVGVVFGLDY